MRELVWDLLIDIKDRVADRLAAHRRTAERINRLQEQVWSLQTEMRVVNVYHHNADASRPAPKLHSVGAGDLH